jgi:hypothetical protein
MRASSDKKTTSATGVNSTRTKLTDPHEGLIRRVRRTPKPIYNPIPDQLTGRLRAPAAAFEPRFPNPEKPDAPVDEALSVNVESSLNAAGLPLTWMVDLKKQYVARITVGDCIANELEAFHAPTKTPQPDNPHHGLIYGLVELHDIDEDRYERTLDELAKTSTIAQF